MATKVDANPLQAGGKIDPTDPIDAGKTVGLMVAGFAVFFTAMAYGQDGAQWLQQLISRFTGVDTGSSGPSMEFTA